MEVQDFHHNIIARRALCSRAQRLRRFARIGKWQYS
jgi:hypothetical protein